MFRASSQGDEEPAVPQPRHVAPGVLPHLRARCVLRGEGQALAALQPPVRGPGVLQGGQDLEGTARPPWRSNTAFIDFLCELKNA